jgi:IS5 family transposase
LRIAIRPGQRRALPDTLDGWLEDLVETAKAHLRAKVEHSFRVIKCQFGFQKTRYRGIKKNDHKLKMLFALTNLYRIRQRRPVTA